MNKATGNIEFTEDFRTKLKFKNQKLKLINFAF